MARSWRLAKSLTTLRAQVNKLAPQRSKASDGTKGDAAHAARKSDHNPNAAGVVQALDITNDPAHGMPARKLAEAVVASRDKRIKYIISEGQIVNGSAGPQAWVWRKYPGPNGHFKHVHFSVRDEAKYYDNPADWDLSRMEKPAASDAPPILKLGANGDWVMTLQERLNAFMFPKLVVDGDFGPITEAKVRAFQSAHNLKPDGIVGPKTWAKLGVN